MIVHSIQVGMNQTNCYVVGSEKSLDGVVIDPGDDARQILSVVKESGLTIGYVLNTHCHFDHIGANAKVVAATGAHLAVHPAELPILQARGGAALFGLRGEESPPPDVELEHGQELEVGELRIQVFHTPGHSPGGVTFYVRDEGAAFDGDVLFRGGVGRHDLPGGDWPTLERSIRDVLYALPDGTVVYPGHGPQTTVAREKRANPWVRGK